MFIAARASESDADDKNHVNLNVLIPVVIVLGVFAFLFFGCLGLPWQQFLGRRFGFKRERQQSYQLDPIIQAKLENIEAGRRLSTAAHPPGHTFEASSLHGRTHIGTNSSAEASRVTIGPEATPWDPTASEPGASRYIQAPPPIYTTK
ncbi:hypothetical protein JDV02_003004 [Purpureocillium takamizusanense]|uniref:Uncharacterized protein n=1 Tax=Purpureocillium takamizusanense TaxID=2060973 RepID=A0A9Q8V8C5_9HYPO|nr:uncharacterized protein JDV02_003004 [Purpureocillium takamizusanense]UNI16578.1 hypothetical protein JDV02_003004 [Purpureocillium takamizusanense]